MRSDLKDGFSDRSGILAHEVEQATADRQVSGASPLGPCVDIVQ